MTTCLGKSCSFGLPRVPFVNYFPFGFEGRMWDLIVSVPDHCLSFYFMQAPNKPEGYHSGSRTCRAKIFSNQDISSHFSHTTFRVTSSHLL